MGWKTLSLDDYTESLEDQPVIQSAGYDDDLSDPQLYTALPGVCLYPPGVVPEGAAVVEYGVTSDSGQRGIQHRRTH